MKRDEERLLSFTFEHLERLKRLALQKLHKAIYEGSPKIDRYQKMVGLISKVIAIKKIEHIGGKNVSN